MALCGLSLHLGSLEGCKTPEQKLSFKQALLSPMVSMNAFHSANLFLFSRHHIPTNSIAPFSAYKYTHNPQFLQFLWWRAIALEMSAFKLYTVANLLTQLIILNYPVILSHWCSTIVSLETYPFTCTAVQHWTWADRKNNSSVLFSFSE